MKIEMIANHAKINMSFGTAYYKIFQDAVLAFAEIKTQEELKSIHQKIIDGEELTEPWEKIFEAILITIMGLETAAKEQNLIELREISDEEGS